MAVTWEKFAAYNEDSKASFESLSSIIFCDIIGTAIKVVPINYPGLEAKPVKGSDGKYYGYQSKFFQASNSTEKQAQIIHSLHRIKDADLATLDVIYIFANTCSDGAEKACEEDWEKHLKSKGITSIKLEWRYGLDFYINHLSDPRFEGAMSMYFGEGRPLKLHDSNVPKQFIEVKQKKYYLSIPILYRGKRTKITHITADKSEVILVQSRAGTGKSWLMYELAHRLGGIGLNYRKRLINIHKNGVTVLLTAHECRNGSVNNVLTSHLASYGIKPFDYPVTLLIDAIDEVGRDSAQYLSESLNKLLRGGQIKSVVITSRTASINSAIVSSLLNPTIYDIDELNDSEILDYFTNKGSRNKTALLRKAMKAKINIEPVRNIRMLETAWAVINEISDFSLETIFQKAYENEVAKLKLDDVNILEPVNDGFESILHEQSYHLQQKEVFDFPLIELQEIILQKLPRANYKDVNEIVSYLKKVCIDSTSSQSQILQFSNRSWVDYFTARYLALKYADGQPSLIIEFSAYEDFINTWFIPVTRKQFIERGQIVKSIALGIIQWYSTDDYSLSWVDKEAEIMTDIGYAKYDPNIIESLSDTVRNSGNLKIIRRAYEAGMQAQAKHSLNKIRAKLMSTNKIPRNVWDDFVDYWYLRVVIDNLKPMDALTAMQELVEININKKATENRPEESDFADKLVKLSNQLVSLSVDSSSIIENIKPNLAKYFFEFIIRPENILLIRQNPQLKTNILTSIESNEDLSVVIKGLLLDNWDDTTIQKAGTLLEKINEESSSNYFHPLAYNVKRLSLLRILSYWKYSDDTYAESPLHSTLTLNHLFNSLYSLIAFMNWEDELSKFMGWLNSDGLYFYDNNRNDSVRLKIAIGDILTGAAKTVLPIQASTELLKSMKQDGKKIYAPYHTMLNIYQCDEQKFRSIFSYDDVLEVVKSSRDDIAERQSTTKDFALIIGMYSSDDLLLFATNSKRDARLRYGYRKDVMGFFLTDALEILWRDRVYSIQQLKEYTWRVYRIILRILEITDGAETHWLPDYMFEVLCKFDMEFADEVYSAFLKDYDYDDESVRTIIIRGAIRRGDSYDSINGRLNKFRPSMLEPGRVVPSYYEEQIVCLADVLQSPRYSQEDKTDAINKMSSFLNRLKKEAKTTRWSYRPDEFSSKLNGAAKAYRSFRKNLQSADELESFPYPHKQKDTFTNEYYKKQTAEGKAAKLALENAQNKDDLINIIDTKMEYGYKYLLKNERGSGLFVKKLEQYNVPFEKIKPIINRAIEEHYYGSQSRFFVKAMWNSAYRNDLLNTFATSMHHTDLQTILYLYSEDGDKNSVRELTSQVTDIIELLTRQDLEKRTEATGSRTSTARLG